MRTFFAEGDMLVAEAQQLYSDRAVGLHTRSTKYGKLRNGMLVTVSPGLIRRCKSHFHSLPCGVNVILGVNGYIWVSAPMADIEESTANNAENRVNAAELDRVTAETLYSSKNDDISRSIRENIVRVANCIQALAKFELPISDTMIVYTYEASLPYESVSDLLQIQVMRDVTTQARRLIELSLQ
jgi:exosome complex component RRP4